MTCSPVHKKLDHLYVVVLSGLVQWRSLLVVEGVNTSIVLYEQAYNTSSNFIHEMMAHFINVRFSKENSKVIDISGAENDLNLCAGSVLHVFEKKKSGCSPVSLDVEPRTVKSGQKDSFLKQYFVYCKVCGGLYPGKLRMRCQTCKQGAILMCQEPGSWADVLTAGRLQGLCKDCDSNQPAQFYFKCGSHDGDEECAPLRHVKPNTRDIECVICTDIRSPILVYPCGDKHVVCVDCFTTYAQTNLDRRSFVADPDIGYSLPCPVGCDNSLIRDIHHFQLLGKVQYERYKDFGAEECVIQAGGVFCPNVGCGAGMIVDQQAKDVHCHACQPMATMEGPDENSALIADDFSDLSEQTYINLGYGTASDLPSQPTAPPAEGDPESDIEELRFRLQYAFLDKELLRSGDRNLKGRQVGSKRAHKKEGASKLYRNYQLFEGAITQITAYFGSNVSSYFRFVRTLVYINLLMAVPLLATLTAPEGELSSSLVFYGLYGETLGFRYNMPLAYLLTWISSNMLAFLAIVSIWRVLAVWDYSVSSRQAVIDQRTSLRTEIKEMVRDEKTSQKVDMCKKCMRWLGRLVSNIVVLALLVGSGLLIYEVADADNILPDSASDGLKDLFQKYQLTVVVAGLKFLVPLIFQQLVRLEGLHPRTETKLTLARTTVFYIASLLVFVTSLYEVTDDCTANSTQVEAGQGNVSCCWENEVGEEVFKVVLVDLGIVIALGSILNLGRALVVRCSCKTIGYSRFDIVSSILDAVYGQGLVWLGLYFCPLLAAVGAIKLVMLFYFRYFLAKVSMVPPQQLFRASSTGNFYLAVLLLMLFISLFPMAYAVIEFQPSSECGPFRVYDRPYHVIRELVGELPEWLDDTLTYLGTPSVFVPILILLILVAIFFKVKASSYKRLIGELRRQLKFERRVEKRRIFATGRAMSGGMLSRYSSQDTITTPMSTPGPRLRRASAKSDHHRPIQEEQSL
ncbi:PRKN-like protein [Mya arenaria]|uniref:PRKN-like protein n=1 Tax=Mya arenaria TaxID=6604 RepID=A0ABY7E9P9_MYAAR|nr:PRKN-like protein [Mya arenaria]